jgi:accessory gene regulator B
MLKAQYAWAVLKVEVWKLIVLTMLFLVTGYFNEFLIAIVILLPIRVFSGGMHFQSNCFCFLFSIMFFIASIFVLPLLDFSILLYAIQIILSGIVIILIAPLPSSQRPICTKKRKIFLKKMASAFVASDCIFLLFLLAQNRIIYFEVGVWILTLQAIQLLIPWIRKYYYERSIK